MLDYRRKILKREESGINNANQGFDNIDGTIEREKSRTK